MSNENRKLTDDEREIMNKTMDMIENKHRSAGTALLMMNRVYGIMDWWGYLDGDHDAIYAWLLKNLDDMYMFLNPEQHSELMKTDNPYSQDFKARHRFVTTLKTPREWPCNA